MSVARAIALGRLAKVHYDEYRHIYEAKKEELVRDDPSLASTFTSRKYLSSKAQRLCKEALMIKYYNEYRKIYEQAVAEGYPRSNNRREVHAE